MAQNYVLLERIELNASAASVTFSNIPQSGYTDLKVVASARFTNASTSTGLAVRFNGVGTNQSARFIQGNGASASSFTDTTIYGDTDAANATANTFSNFELYVPNYTSSNNKSVSIDNVMENNATTAYAMLEAGLWSSSAAITSITFQDYSASASLAQYSTFSLYALAAVGTTPAIAPKASGGNITTDGTYWYHTFLTSGTFTPATTLACDALVIAGGGGGGGYAYTGGGGAGGLYYSTSNSLITSSYTITVGAGGAGGINSSGVTSLGSNGTNSQIGSLTAAVGGGGGGGYGSTLGSNGGSGGGGSSGSAGGTATSGQGFAGGSSSGSGFGGGGGGSGAVGGTGSGSASGTGGAGLNTYSSWATATNTGVSNYYAGGGGGGASASPAESAGGAGAGGAGAGGATNANGGAATINTGSGGGGGGWNAGTGYSGGAGGSGIVIIRYTIA